MEGNRGYSQYELEHIQVVDHNSHAPWNEITQLQNNDGKSSTFINKLEQKISLQDKSHWIYLP